MQKKDKKEKPVPRKCVCGATAITVKTRSGKMVTCPNPMRCEGNLRTSWNRSEDQAIAEWNNLVSTFISEKRNTRRKRI